MPKTHKFKAGDKVIVLSVDKSLASKKLIGEEVLISNILRNGEGYYIQSGWYLVEEELEFANIYNSPLYKALL